MSQTSPQKTTDILTGSQDEITDKIVAKIWKLINRDYSAPIVKQLAQSLKKGNKFDTIKSVYDYVWQNFPYKADPQGIEHLTAPVHILSGVQTQYMDCDEMVTLICSLLKANGINCLIKTIAWRKHSYTHVVCEAEFESGKWIVLDATRKAQGFGGQELKVIREKRYK